MTFLLCLLMLMAPLSSLLVLITFYNCSYLQCNIHILEKAMAPHSSTLAWKIPWMEEPGWAAVHGVAKSWTWLSDFPFTFHFHALEKEMTTHSSVLAWRVPGMGEPGGLPSLGSHIVGHDWSDLASSNTYLTFSIRLYFFYLWVMIT